MSMDRASPARRSGSMSSLFYTLRRMGSKGSIFSSNNDSSRRSLKKQRKTLPEDFDRRQSLEYEHNLPPPAPGVYHNVRQSRPLCHKVY